MRKKSQSRPPIGLSREAKKLWTDICAEFDVSDAAGRRLLLTACESLDMLRRSEAQIAIDGLTTTDRFGTTRGHPLLGTIRDSRAAMMSALRALNFDVAPAKSISRLVGR